MLGRKDIPPIRLTYSQASTASGQKPEYLRFLENQREELTRQISQAPKYRLDHLADYVETHGERLSHLLEALLAYQKRRRQRRLRQLAVGALIAALVGAGTYLLLSGVQAFPEHEDMRAVSAALAAVAVAVLWALVVIPWAIASFHGKALGRVDTLTPLDNQTRRDSWAAVRELVLGTLTRTGGRFPAAEVRQDHQAVRRVCEKGSKEIRAALNELSTIRHE
jgi:hypothetical protein